MTRTGILSWAVRLLLSLGLAAPALARNQEQQPDRDPLAGAMAQQSVGQNHEDGQTDDFQTFNATQHSNRFPLWLSTREQQAPAQVGDDLVWFAYTNLPAGMDLAAADDSLREHLKLPKDQGLVVLSLDPQSPPAQAGIQQNDVLLLVGDAPVAKPEELDDRLKQAGEEPVALTVLRGGKRLQFKVQPQVRVTLGPVQAEPPAFWIGVSVASIESALRAQLQIPEGKGLVVTEVVKESPAAHVGVKIHDILLSLAAKPLGNQEQLVELVQKNGEKSAAVELIREGKTQTIEITPQRRKADRLRANVKYGPIHSYRFVRPGAVFDNWSGAPQDWKLKAFPQTHNGITGWTTEKLTGASQTKDDVSKRLDDLDAQLKQLSKAIEELSKAVKAK